MRRLPSWFRQELPTVEVLEKLQFLRRRRVHTVCQEAHCPNINVCFKQAQVTFLILGRLCSRTCAFCAVEKSPAADLVLDKDEPGRIARLVKELGLSYVVITSVSRDDLPDGGAGIFAETIKQIHNLCPATKVEVLIPDFKGSVSGLRQVAQAGAEVVGHNLETVARLYSRLRKEANYRLSLRVLKYIKQLRPQLITKSSLMLGLGERQEEVVTAMRHLRQGQCDILSLGQYLAPSAAHYPTQEFIRPQQFKAYESFAYRLGFKAVLAGPRVRSSYQAAETFDARRV